MIFNRYFHLLLAFAMVITVANAQQPVLTGTIYDSQTKQTLSGVNISRLSGPVVGQTDNKGHFSVEGLADGTEVRFGLVGFKTQTLVFRSGAGQLNVQMDADEASLNEVRVTGFAGNRTRKETAGSVALVTAQEINRGSGLSFQSALNAIPGVRMDQSTLSEAKISIRGNGVRSSYGLRSVKVYLNDIPLTEADGTTRIEALDVNSIGRIEVIKGPASSIYGAGTAGVINFQLQRSPYHEQSFEASALAGSYGLHRLAGTYRSGGDKINSYVAYGWQEYQGYRQHSSDMRRFLSGNFQLFPTDNRIITLLVNRTTQYSQIPGSLTAGQVAADPVQANAANLDKQAGRYQTWTRLGMGQQYKFNDQLSNSTSVFTYSYDLNHPLPYAYLRNYYQSYGGRTAFTFNPEFSVMPTKFIVGSEFNQALTKGAQYVNNQGIEGAIQSNIDYKNTFLSVFYQSETALASHTLLTLGLGYNGLNYQISNYLVPAQSGTKKFKPQATPRIALSQHISDELSVHGSISSGFSPPSSSEIQNADGEVNTALQAEKAVQYELNAKGNLLNSRLSYDVAVFQTDVKGELIAQSVQQGITVYNNAGRTTHKGAELSLSWQAIRSADHMGIVSLRPFLGLTFSDFKFRDYKTLSSNNTVTAVYDGNKLTGIAPWVISAGADLEVSGGIYCFVNYYYNDKIPLNDGNSDFSAAYQLLNAKAGYRHHLGKAFEVNVYAGMDNLLNKAYSSILSLNAVAYGGGQPAYFNPSPKRNGYAGCALKYLIR